ncbi:PAS domain S-box-containing protein/diguanylate cyclase (GGDEF) domain-containing protein [Ensifer adhaerens]|nr:PAS domain S-box-containing protein/diguanylate cyclase (GGDEF) domain-containing protein [Ensifer adhaerens]
MHTHSVEKRFLLIICAAVLIFVMPLFGLFFYLSAERTLNERMERIDLTMLTNAQALGKPLWDFDIDSARKVAAAIAAGGEIEAVHVRDTSGSIAISVPTNGTKHGVATRRFSTPINYASVDGEKHVGTLEVEVDGGGLISTIGPRDISFMFIFVFAVAIVFLASVIANRVIVIRPLLRLIDAVVQTRRSGYRQRVDWYSRDEMGMLADNFNEMQSELAHEESALKAAHALVQAVYNKTPAMLYMIDADGRIAAVSDYWMFATGYTRDEVTGRHFTDFLARGETWRPGLHAQNATAPDANTCTIKFQCADSRIIDVLVRETPMGAGAEQTSALCVMTDVTELKEAETRNHIQAITDHLTGLLNRQGFEAALDGKIIEADRRGHQLACLFVDLDRFKWINDNLGHAAGDDVLKEVVSRATAQLRPSDVIARLGGDEFAILISAPDAEAIARGVSSRIKSIFAAPFTPEGASVTLSASIGIALYPRHASCAAELLQKSDLAMYARKRNGKNGTEVFDDSMADSARERAELERYINEALENDWFDAWLQPICDLETGRPTNFEALMRLRHPAHGVLPPAKIIAVAEENGTIEAIGNVILRKAVEYLARISTIPGLESARMSINFSPLQLNADLLARMSDILMKSGIQPSRIVLEITEAVLMRNNPEINMVLRGLRDCGMSIALDDFGTGYSSLSYLHRFPVNIVKVDRSFVASLHPDSAIERDKPYLLIQGINTIAQHLNCKVVAEGIETPSQREILKDMGIQFGQGYLFSRPLSIDDIEQLYNPTGERLSGRA